MTLLGVAATILAQYLKVVPAPHQGTDDELLTALQYLAKAKAGQIVLDEADRSALRQIRTMIDELAK